MDEEETNEEPEVTTSTEDDRVPSELERKKAELAEREELIEKEKDIMAEEKKMIARKEMGGRSEAGTETTPEFTDEEKASRKRIKSVADASGSEWGKKYE